MICHFDLWQTFGRNSDGAWLLRGPCCACKSTKLLFKKSVRQKYCFLKCILLCIFELTLKSQNMLFCVLGTEFKELHKKQGLYV